MGGSGPIPDFKFEFCNFKFEIGLASRKRFPEIQSWAGLDFLLYMKHPLEPSSLSLAEALFGVSPFDPAKTDVTANNARTEGSSGVFPSCP
jgi:hypothetical protein